ncbi:uncharacterized protein B0H64DRAFT_374806 [Chaetomium fimeti]|uniref:Uncharacterized protein n=1 Tax=Chaetomium fimeti TaxID=1854472 RepID=A0AAE0LQN8_9PEZI|nr:hypothetical protein B0H64DRAFT_374806 [Chaetomium fimeti]
MSVASGNDEGVDERAILTKRRVPDVDEIELISSNPVKKRRSTKHNPSQTAQGPMNTPQLPPPDRPRPPACPPSPAHPPPPSQAPLITNPATPAPSQTLTADRYRSMCDVNQAQAPRPGSTHETRGNSLLTLEKFAFPPSLAPTQTHPRQPSEAISPKQLPQVYRAPPGAGANTNERPLNTDQPLLPTPRPSLENSVTLDQISCLDFNGTPTNTPGFDVSQIFSTIDGIMSGVEFGNAVNPMYGPAPPNLPNTHNFVPSMTHSAGSIMTIPQAQNIPLSVTPLQNQPQQHGTPTPGITSNTQAQFSHSHPAGRSMVFQGPPPSPAPEANPPCPHCGRMQQEARMRPAQNPPPIDAMQPHHPAYQQPNCHPPPAPPVNNNPIPSPAPAHPAPTPHPPQPGNHQRRHDQYHPTSLSSSPAAHAELAPNAFLQDVAQTVQVSFPYAQVAAQHGMSLTTVAEALSSLVVVPLLLRGMLPRAE